MHIHVVCV